MIEKENDDWRATLTWFILPAGRAWQRAAGRAFSDHGISLSLAAPILVISRLGGGGVNQKAVAEETGINPATIVRSLDQLEASGLLERHNDEIDRRVKTLHLTKKGKKLASELEDILDALMRQMLSDVSAREGAAAAKVVKTLESVSRSFAATGCRLGPTGDQ